MKEVVHVDLDKCEGHGRCYQIAPHLFDAFDDEDHAEFLASAFDPADAKLVELADQAIESCPERALSWKVD